MKDELEQEARVTIRARLRKDLRAKHERHQRFKMSTDLPAKDLGQAVAEMVRQMYEAGYEPCQTEMRIRFDSYPVLVKGEPK